MRTTLAALISAALMAGACGGGSVETAPAEVAPTPPPQPVVRAEPEPNPYEGLLWYVYWEGIHCLTIYPQPGLVRSEEPHNANATFQSRNEHVSIISVYYEREDAWAPVIEAATSVDDLLARLRAMEAVEVEEAVNPVQSEDY